MSSVHHRFAISVKEALKCSAYKCQSCLHNVEEAHFEHSSSFSCTNQRHDSLPHIFLWLNILQPLDVTGIYLYAKYLCCIRKLMEALETLQGFRDVWLWIWSWSHSSLQLRSCWKVFTTGKPRVRSDDGYIKQHTGSQTWYNHHYCSLSQYDIAVLKRHCGANMLSFQSHISFVCF